MSSFSNFEMAAINESIMDEFISVTGTSKDNATKYLQENAWVLESSINAYFETTEKEDSELANKKPKFETLDVNTSTSKPPSELKFLTWNVDGLDERDLMKRIANVALKIQKEKPDIVFLQEIIEEMYVFLTNKLKEYKLIPSDHGGMYFTVILLRKQTITYVKHEVHPYFTTKMDRNLLSVDAQIGTLKLKLFNTHLESTASCAEERTKQLKYAFQKCSETNKDLVVIFAGDLNLREKDLKNAGGIPVGFEDVWTQCGAKKDVQYTWDLTCNTNKDIPGFKYRCRFDRVYVRDSIPSKVNPKSFEFFGKERVPFTELFPSDHFGIFINFEIKQSV